MVFIQCNLSNTSDISLEGNSFVFSDKTKYYLQSQRINITLTEQERAKAMLKKARQKKCKPKAQSDVEDTPAVASLEDVGRRIKTIRRKIKRAIALRTIAAEGRELPSKDAAKVDALDEMERELAVLREGHKRLTRAARRSAQELEMAAAAEMAAAPPVAKRSGSSRRTSPA